MEMRSERGSIQALRKEGNQFLVFPPIGVTLLPPCFAFHLVECALAMELEFVWRVASCGPARRMLRVNFVVAVRTESNAVGNIVIIGDDVVYLNAVQLTTDAAPSSAVGKKLRHLGFVKAHVCSPFRRASNAQHHPRREAPLGASLCYVTGSRALRSLSANRANDESGLIVSLNRAANALSSSPNILII